MVVRINTGKSITGVLRYNELMRDTGKAELISSNGFLPEVENLNSFQLGKRFRELTALNTRTKTNALHISLNFAPGESIDTELMKEIAHSYLDKIGFGNQPCLVAQQYHEKYGFNLEETLKKFPIKELNDQTKTEWMVKALQKGNTYPVVMDKAGKEEVMFIEANPKFKSINVYDSQMNSVKSNELMVKGSEKPDLDDKKKDLTEGMKANRPEGSVDQKVPKARKGNKI